MSARRRMPFSTVLRTAGAGVLASALVTALAVTAPATAASRASTSTSVTASAPAPTGRAAAAVEDRLRLLPTGDRVLVGSVEGRASYGVLRAAGSSGPVQHLDGGGAHYVVPAAVAPLVGGLLDPALFDVARPGSSTGGLALTIRHSGASPRLPGVTVTRDAAGVATAVVTPASAPSLGAALQREARAVSAGAATGAFSGITRIETAGAASTTSPSFVMHTLVIKGIDDQGAPARSASGLLMNVVDGRRYVGFVSIRRGEARVSVPAGVYSGAFFLGRRTADGTFATQLVPVPETTVSGDGVVLTIDARTATLTPRVTTPRPVTGGEVDLTYSRGDTAGSGVSLGIGSALGDALRVAPVAAPTRGTQSLTTAFHLDGPSADAYAYDLSVSSPTVDRAAVQPVLPTGALTTVTERHDTDTDGQATVFGRGAVDEGSFFVFTTLRPLAVPVTTTSYVYSPTAVGWSETELGNTRADDWDLIGAFERYAPGTTRAVSWRHAPLAPAVPDLAVNRACLACRSSEGLTLVLDPLQDGTRTHSSQIFSSVDGTPVTHFSLTRGASTLFDEDDYFGVMMPVPAARATYTAALDVDHYGADPVLSTRSHTELSFSSAAGEGPAAPAAWGCASCRVLPVLQGRALLPTDGRGGIAAGRRTLTVALGRVPGAEPAGVTSGTITVRPAGFFPQEYPLVSAGGGRYSAQVDLPAFLVGSKVDLSISARDSGGSTFAQTVQRAFVITEPAAAAPGVAATTGGAVTRSAGASGWTAAPRSACSTARPGAVRCLARWLPGSGALAPAAGGSKAAAPREGYGPADIQAAYGLDPTAGAGQTVAIVGAFDNPRLEADLAVARRTWGLPACTSANGCFRKVDQRGGRQLPTPDPGWGLELALDTQAVSAACPRCRILVVEADSPSLTDIGEAVNRAVSLGATIVNNSYGTDEFAGMQRFARDYYTHPGVAQVVSSGDFGFTTASFPAVLPSSVAVGGTTLTKPTASSWSEKVWSGAGSGCSAYVAKPAWQRDTHCSMRTVADVSAVADPQTGLAVYDTFGLGASNGWIVVGGTSLSAPLVAGMIGLAGNAPTMATAARTYARTSALHDVVGGANGFCGGDYLCRGVKGYDAPTGNGSPVGVGAL